MMLQIGLEMSLFCKLLYFNTMALTKIQLRCAVFVRHKKSYPYIFAYSTSLINLQIRLEITLIFNLKYFNGMALTRIFL